MQLVIITCASLMLVPFANAQKYHAFIWSSAGGMADLGTLGGDTSYALGINDSGEVVGYSYLADNVTRHAFTWTASGGMVDLGTLPGGAWSQAIVGWSSTALEQTHAALWSNYTSVPQDLGTLPGGTISYAYGINRSGQVIGFSTVP